MAKITAIGIGPGSLEDMTPRARKAIDSAVVIAGYNTYVNLIRDIIEDKEVIGTGMMQEVDRCHMAVESARAEATQDKPLGCMMYALLLIR